MKGLCGCIACRKREAVEQEDYDAAKALKQDIDRLRSAGEAAANGHTHPNGSLQQTPLQKHDVSPNQLV